MLYYFFFYRFKLLNTQSKNSVCVVRADCIWVFSSLVRKRAKIKNRYNQVPHLTLDTNGKVKNTIRHHKREPRGQTFPSRKKMESLTLHINSCWHPVEAKITVQYVNEHPTSSTLLIFGDDNFTILSKKSKWTNP